MADQSDADRKKKFYTQQRLRDEASASAAGSGELQKIYSKLGSPGVEGLKNKAANATTALLRSSFDPLKARKATPTEAVDMVEGPIGKGLRQGADVAGDLALAGKAAPVRAAGEGLFEIAREAAPKVAKAVAKRTIPGAARAAAPAAKVAARKAMTTPQAKTVEKVSARGKTPASSGPLKNPRAAGTNLRARGMAPRQMAKHIERVQSAKRDLDAQRAAKPVRKAAQKSAPAKSKTTVTKGKAADKAMAAGKAKHGERASSLNAKLLEKLYKESP